MNDFWKENNLDGSQGDLRALGHPQRPRLALVELVEVAEGAQEPLDHPVSRWDCFKSICLWKIAYKHVSCQFLMNMTGTCCTRLGWACRGRWGCPKTKRNPCKATEKFPQISEVDLPLIFGYCSGLEKEVGARHLLSNTILLLVLLAMNKDFEIKIKT